MTVSILHSTRAPGRMQRLLFPAGFQLPGSALHPYFSPWTCSGFSSQLNGLARSRAPAPLALS